MPSNLAERIEMARHHVSKGRAVLSRHRQLVANQQARGLDAAISEELLVQFERSQAIFEEDLERLLREQDRR
jgi:hypothetical protein